MGSSFVRAGRDRGATLADLTSKLGLQVSFQVRQCMLKPITTRV
jgi:hypothetical protein